MGQSKTKRQHFKCDFFSKLYEHMSNMKYDKLFNAYVKSYRLSFRELPSSDTFFQISVDAERLPYHFPFIFFENLWFG